MPTDPLLQQEQLDKSLGKAKISGPISEVSDSMYAQRLMFKAHQSRLSNINKIPKAVPVSGPGAVRDLLILEAKLNELGFSRDSMYHRSLQEEHNRRSSPSTDPALSQSSARMSSDLGESFMVLKPASTGVGLKPETSSAAVRSVGGLVPKGGELKVFASSPPQPSPLVGEPILAAYGGGNSVKIKNVAAHQRADSSGSSKGASTGHSGGSFSSTGVTPTSTTSSSSSSTTWANNLLNWGGFGSGSGSASDTSRVSPAGGKSTTVSADTAQVGAGHHREDQTLSWNEQSLMLASRDTSKGVMASSLLQSGVRSVSSRDSSPDKSSGRAIASAVFEDLSRSTLRSLDSEGHNSEGVSNLLKTVNRLGEENAQLLSRIELMSQVEARQRQMEREVETFKQEYSEKFKNVKRVLREYSTKFQAEDNPVSVATKALQESAEADKALQRQQELERTVQALLGRLQKATVELNRKDSLLRAIDPKYAAQPPEKASKSSSSSSSSDLPAVGGRGIAMSPETEQQHSHSSHNVQQSRQHHLSLATTSSSRHVSGGSSRPSAGSPGPSKRQSVSLPSKHPSTATLEALQKSKQQS